MADTTLYRVAPDDRGYRKQARAEAAYWNSGAKGLSDVDDLPGGGGVAGEHYNRRFTGDPTVRWFDTLNSYGDFRRGIALGAGGVGREARILETNPGLHLTVCDISPGALREREQTLVPSFPGRVATRLADFNFIELEAASYDFVVSSSSLHHVINLEHVAAQISGALTADGLFFLEDYVGESRRRFTPEKKAAFEEVYGREMARQGRTAVPLEWSDGDAYASPFCGVRAAEILPLFRSQMEEVSVRTAGALWYPLMLARDPRRLVTSPLRRWTLRLKRRAARAIGRPQSGGFALPDEYLRDLLETGDRLSDAGLLLPSNAFAIYRRRR